MPYFNIANSVAFVTGTNKQNGIGRAIVRALLAAGAKKVYATARSQSQLKDLVSESPENIIPVALDVTSAHQIATLAARFGDVNLLVNNAGVFSSTGTLDDVDKIQLEMEVNFFGPLRVTQAFSKVFRAHRGTAETFGSAVVNINSIASLVNFPQSGTYSASKAASHSLTQAQRRDLDSSLVVGVYPGPIDTEMTRELAFEKSNPSIVAQAIVEALASGTEDVYPDPMAVELFESWKKDAKSVEKMMAAPQI